MQYSAVFVHLASHRVNLALSSALSIKNDGNCLSVMNDIIHCLVIMLYPEKLLNMPLKNLFQKPKKRNQA